MSEDKSTPRPWDDAVVERVAKALYAQNDYVSWDGMGEAFKEAWRRTARAAIAAMPAVNSHDAMKECVEALKKIVDEVDEGGLTPDGNMIAALIDLSLAKRARSALSKLEKATVSADLNPKG